MNTQGLDLAVDLINTKLEGYWGDPDGEGKALYQREPEKWVWDSLGYELTNEQPQIIRAVSRGEDTAVRSGHKCGKTFILAVCVLYWLDVFGPSMALTTAPGQRQLKHILWAEIGRLYKRWKRRHSFVLTKGMWLYHRNDPDKWYALGVYSNEADKIEGFHAGGAKDGKLLAVVDEGKTIDSEFFEAVTSMHGQRLVASVPPLDGQGYFAQIFKKYRDIWKCIHMNALNSTLIDPAWIKKREVDWVKGSVIWQAKIEGNIPDAGRMTDLVITTSKVEKAQTRYNWVEYEKKSLNRRVGIACDVARFGDDLTVSGVGHEYLDHKLPWSKPGLPDSLPIRRVDKIDWVKGQDTMGTVGMIREQAINEAKLLLPTAAPEAQIEYAKKKIPIWVDDTGVGGGVVDRLKELKYKVTGVNFGSSALDPLYKGRDTELWFWLDEDLDLYQLPSDEQFDGAGGRLSSELCSRKYKYLSDGKKIESKDEIKKPDRLGRSPDHADMLVLLNGLFHSQYLAPTVKVEVW